MATKKKVKKSKFIINVPVFVTKRLPAGSMFELTYDTLIEGALNLINHYNKEEEFIILNKRNKLFQRQIGKINHEKCFVGDVPALLLSVSAYTLNRKGEHLKENEILTVEPTDRIGDNRNFFLLLPELTNENAKHYNWLALVYDDPTRETEEVISIVKSIMNDIINQPIKNIKLPTLLEELKKASPRITLNLNSVNNNEDGIDSKLQVYETESRSFIKKEYKFSGMPIDRIEELIHDKFEKKFKQKILKFIVGQKEYKIKQEIDNFKDGNNLLVEQYFNFAEEVVPADVEKVYTKDFMLGIMGKVITKYFTNGET